VFEFKLFSKKKKLDLPKGIFFCGMLGVGKTKLVNELMDVLCKYKYTKISEFKTQKELDELYKALRNHDFKKQRNIVFRNNLYLMNRIVETINNPNQNFICDCLPLGEVFIGAFMNNFAESKNKFDVLNMYEYMVLKFEKEVTKNNISNDELKNMCFVLLKNKHSKYQFYYRKIATEYIPYELYDDFEKHFILVLQRFGQYLRSREIKFLEFDTTKFDVESDDFKEFFIEKVLVKKIID